MEENWSSRTALLLGSEGLQRLQNAHVLLVGVGGVGGVAAEMLARAGVGTLTLVDGDEVKASNINRQFCALHSTLGGSKAELTRQRLLDINPLLNIVVENKFLEVDDMEPLLSQTRYDYVIDAIDTLSPKVALLATAYRLGLPVIASMGAGAKRDPAQVQLSDISKTYACALARQVRTRLRKQSIRKGIPVVFSSEIANQNAILHSSKENYKSSTLGTISFLPAIFGCHLAAHVINELAGDRRDDW